MPGLPVRIHGSLIRYLVRNTIPRSVALQRATADDMHVVVVPARIRILVAGLPRMLTEIIHGAVGVQDDMELMPPAVLGAVATDVIAANPDVVILGPSDLDSVLRLLTARPRLAVVVVGAQGREAFLYGTRPQRSSLGELSPDNLVSVIRDAARATWSFEGMTQAPEPIEGRASD